VRCTVRKESSIRSYPRNSDKEFPPLNNSVVVRSVGTVIRKLVMVKRYLKICKFNITLS